MPAPAECPVCGERVPPRARACPHCGADERSGWNEEDSRYDGLDLPESAFEDEDAPAPSRRPRRAGPHPVWYFVGAVLIMLLVLRALALG